MTTPNEISSSVDTKKIPPPANGVEEAQPQKKNTSFAWILTLVFFLVAIGFASAYLFYFRFHESTDDAYVNGYMVNVTVQNPGRPIAFFADNTDFVERGQVLILMDPTDFQIVFDRRKAELALAAQQVRERWETVEQKKALVSLQKVELERARVDFFNRSGLVDIKAISNEDFIHSKESVEAAEANLKKAEHDLLFALAGIGSHHLANHPLIEQAKANLREAYANLKRCTILAPISGYVANRNVEVGQWVNAKDALMTIVPLDSVWVDANFKESQLRDIRIGQKVYVSVDMYGGSINFEGKVFGLTPGTGSVFSLLPPQNATGNWIKIVQRVPVRISLNSEQVRKYPVFLGLSANVNIDITNKKGDQLSTIIPQKPIASTEVFEIPLEGLEMLMQKIIEDNLQLHIDSVAER